MAIIKALFIFILAELRWNRGGYLIWLWLKEGKPFWFGILGMIILGMYGVVATFQPSNFGRVYAAYGGIFVVMALLWSFKVDNFVPDKFDIIGAAIILLGTWFIFFAPRS
ncbi:MAG: YnfA family protein [Saprospiraceae bacterium]|nr:YnfA family protein [Saprospiraceae bacterium]